MMDTFTISGRTAVGLRMTFFKETEAEARRCITLSDFVSWALWKNGEMIDALNWKG